MYEWDLDFLRGEIIRGFIDEGAGVHQPHVTIHTHMHTCMAWHAWHVHSPGPQAIRIILSHRMPAMPGLGGGSPGGGGVVSSLPGVGRWGKTTRSHLGITIHAQWGSQSQGRSLVGKGLPGRNHNTKLSSLGKQSFNGTHRHIIKWNGGRSGLGRWGSAVPTCLSVLLNVKAINL